MQRRTGRLNHRWAMIGFAVTAATFFALTCVATAWAAPPPTTISETDLNTLLQAGPVSGYFETVLGGATLADQQPVQIPVTIKSIVPDYGLSGDLILFQASGTEIDTIGGIAEGMSGSPLYVDDNGTDKLAGAVAYGDPFTTQNLGLATPIADMTALESTYFTGPDALKAVRLRSPLAAAGGDVSKIVIAPSRAAAARLHPASGTVVMAPLAAVQVNGLIVGSPVYKKLAARLAKLGLDLVPQAAGPAFDLPSLPDMTGGSSLGVMYSDGDFAAGALGTVTYVDPDNGVVVAFGHPLDFLGAVSYDLTSAWVHGIWSDSETPYKVMSPVDVVGEVTQDRGAGVAGTLGSPPVEVPVTSTATLGGATRTSASTVTQAVTDDADFFGLPSAAASVAMQRVADVAAFRGSASTTTTIDVSDATGSYQIKRSDVWNDSFDVMSDATGDIDNALATLTSGLPGLSPKVDSIDLAVTLSAADASATIQDVSVSGGLKTGDNDLTVTLLTGAGQTVHVPVTLTIPPDDSTSGTLDVAAATAGSDGSGSGPGGPLGESPALGAGAETLAQVVADLNAAPKNSDVSVVFTPENVGAVIQPIQAFGDAGDSVVQGEVVKSTGTIDLMVPKVVGFEEPVFVFGMIEEADASGTVRIYARQAGQASDTLVASVPATLGNDGSAEFDALVTGLKRTTRLTAVWDGDADHLAVSSGATVAMRARASLSAAVHTVAGRPEVRFAAHLTPAQSGGRVFIERLRGRTWVRVANLAANGPLTGVWRPSAGSYQLRAVFGGSPANATVASRGVRVTVP